MCETYPDNTMYFDNVCTSEFNEHCTNEETQNFFYHDKNIDHYYNLESTPRVKNFSCQICNKDFYSQNQYKKHIDEHVECPFPECGLKASLKFIDQHIYAQHMLVNFEALQADNKTWIAERKKKFPSSEKVQLIKAQKIEKAKRGERIEKDNKKFTKKETKRNSDANRRKFKRNNHDKDGEEEVWESKKNYRNNNNCNVIQENAEDSDSETNYGIPAFKGTKSFYENIGELSLFGFKSSFVTDEKQPNLDISEDEDVDNTWNESDDKINKNKCVLHNALGSLMSAYDSNSDIEEDNNNDSQEKLTSLTINKVENLNITVVDTNKNSNVDSKERFSKRKRRHANGENSKTKKTKPVDNSSKKYRRRTLLQKLLEPNIVHERNVILQCVRFIVDNNFFDSSNIDSVS